MAESPGGPPDRARPTTAAELTDHVDRRFDSVDEALVEQRQYTEFAFDNVHQDVVDVKSGLGRLEQDVRGVETRLGRLEGDMAVVKSGVGRLERKLDRLIDREPPTAKAESSE